MHASTWLYLHEVLQSLHGTDYPKIREELPAKICSNQRWQEGCENGLESRNKGCGFTARVGKEVTHSPTEGKQSSVQPASSYAAP